MKTCPVCGARCFDDMDVCYGCMHRFGPDRAAPAPQAATVFGQAASPAACQGASSASRLVDGSSEASSFGKGASAELPGEAADAGAAVRTQASSAPAGASSGPGSSLSEGPSPAEVRLGLHAGAAERTDGGRAPARDALAQPGASARSAALVSQPISLGELTQGMAFQLVVTLRPCPPASAGEGA